MAELWDANIIFHQDDIKYGFITSKEQLENYFNMTCVEVVITEYLPRCVAIEILFSNQLREYYYMKTEMYKEWLVEHLKQQKVNWQKEGF